MIREKLHTVSDVAEAIGLTTGRVRQICRQHDIGQLFASTRLLSDKDVKRLKSIPDRRAKSKNVGKYQH